MTNSRTKGNKGQRIAAKVLKDWTRKPFASTPRSGGLRWGAMSTVIGDVVCTKEGHYFPFCVEVKSYLHINFEHPLYTVKGDLYSFWDQVNDDALRAKKIPLLMIRYNRLPKEFFFVGVPSKDYEQLFKGVSMKELNKVMTIQHMGLTIFTTPELVNTDYKEVRQNAKLILKTRYEKT